MKREILLSYECTAIAAKNGLAGLHEFALSLHSEKMCRDLSEFFSESPTIVTGFYFNPACGECGVIAAIAGQSHEEDGLEGCRFFFQAHEVAEARAALMAELDQYEAPECTPRFSVVPANA